MLRWYRIIIFIFHIYLLQESVLILAKLLLPEIFEKMSMQDLRVLVAERSMMSKYIRGETIEVPHQYICFLLEGFVKTSEGMNGLITSPAALFPASVDLQSGILFVIPKPTIYHTNHI